MLGAALMTPLWLLIAAWGGAVTLTGLVRWFALRRRVLAIPNARSSHDTPVPSLGGIGIVVPFAIGLLWLWQIGRVPDDLTFALLMGGGLVAVVGLVDDLRPLSPLIRLIVHISAAVVGLVAIGGMPPLDLGFMLWQWGWLGHIIGVIGLVWLVNLVNFMDGIDGLAALETIVVCVVVLLLFLWRNGLIFWPNALLAAVCFGFLLWNLSPARIFMGDVASGFLGYALGILAIFMASWQPLFMWVWALLLALFVVDTTTTLLRRMIRGERWYAPHRSHAYQHLAQRYGHRPVTFGQALFNLVVLLPIVVLVLLEPSLTLWAVGLTYGGLALLALLLGAGVPDRSQKQVDQ